MTQSRTIERIEAWLSAFTETSVSFFLLFVFVLPNQRANRIPVPLFLFLLLLFTIHRLLQHFHRTGHQKHHRP